MPPPIFEEHLRALLREERLTSSRMASLYERFRLRIFDLLSDQNVDEISIRILSGLSREVQSEIKSFVKDLKEELGQSLRTGVTISVKDIIEEIEKLNAGIRGGQVDLNIRAAAVLSRSEKLLVTQYDASTARYGEELRGRMARVLSDAAVRNQSIDTVTRRLAGTKGLIRTEEWKVERIARTEFLNGYNTGRLQTIHDAKKVLPDLKKRWDATLDKRTSDICQDLHGKVVGVDQDFEFDGIKIQAPPAHPNCRSAVIPYRDAWEDKF